jgi:hypothetical protein
MLDRLNAAFNRLPDVAFSGPALPPLMISQAQSAFLAAVRTSLGGQVHVAYMALRGCVECALYALIMHHQPSSQLVGWVERSDTHRHQSPSVSPSAPGQIAVKTFSRKS